MPELPEVETVRLGLAKRLPGKYVRQVDVLRKESIGYPGSLEFEQALVGHQFETLSRRGKYLLIHLDRGAGLAVHLRMSGCLILAEATTPASKHLRVLLSLANEDTSGEWLSRKGSSSKTTSAKTTIRQKRSSGSPLTDALVDEQELRFEDMRVFGRLWYVPPGMQFEEVVPGLAELGPEPLEDLTTSYLYEALRNRRQAIKSVLLDQHVIAGVGNIYADESLFEAQINPTRQASSLSKKEVARLIDTVQSVLTNAIAAGGSTIRDYLNSEGTNGNYQNEAWVYGRTGEPCKICRTPIQRVKLAGRSSHFCAKCQKRGQL